jgi:hypothetical protein
VNPFLDELNMPAAEDDVYINRVPYYIMRRLEKALDAEDKWRDLLGAIGEAELDGPPLEPDYVYVLQNCAKRRQSPTETLLNELGMKGYKVMDLKHWLRFAELNQALDLLEGGNPTTGFISAAHSSFGRYHSYSGKENEHPLVVQQPTTPTERRAVGQTIKLLSSSLKNYTAGVEDEISDSECGAGVGESVVKSYGENFTRRRRTEERTSSKSQESWSTPAPLSSQSVPEIKHRHNLVTPSSTVPPSSEEHTSGQSSTYPHTAQG